MMKRKECVPMNNIITTKDLASLLNGRKHMSEITKEEERLAKENGLVVLCGYSDDNMEFYGALREEISCFDGGSAYIKPTEISAEPNDGKEIEAIWCAQGCPCWTYKTDIPHETFNVYDNDDSGELFCIGIVFSIKDI